MKAPRKHGSGSRLPTDVDRLVGDNVRRLRTQRGKSLTGLSVELGISHQQLQKYETGSNRLSAGVIARLSDIFGVPVAVLFQKPETKLEGRASQHPGRMDALRREAAFLIERMHTEESLKLMVDVLRALSGKC
ncbi:helix-turn-helix domain-containing protein [Hyphomonas sp. NPDC076900]|uniref:helix-turn-helix domain-containing protein n=1 Tax=unclassified Hyphomonas TaxID=2630699 RepID=UPI003D00D485